MKFKICTFIALLIGVLSYSQLTDYNYERALDGVTEDWHSITIPNDVFGKVSPSLKDIRVYGVSSTKDTVEVPYILKVNSEKFKSVQESFEILNRVAANDGYYYTFKLEEGTSINNIDLSFKNDNFDWKVNVEGSQNQQEWFKILNDYRILSIKNESSSYSFTKLRFPSASYKYFRVFIKSDVKPELESSKISKRQRTDGVFIDYQVKTMKLTDNKFKKSTSLDFELNNPVSVSRLKVNVAANYDYFRSVNFEYLKDSVQTEKGWKYNYRTFKSGTLTSLEENEIKFNSIIAQKFRMIVSNNDNQPLNIESISVKGFKHELIARFTEAADYRLVYGNNKTYRADYDITKFKNNIPSNLKPLSVGEEKEIEQKKVEGISALFENEIWLWAIMGIVILLLGGFTYKMLQKA